LTNKVTNKTNKGKTNKGQTTIPKAVRTALGLRAGDEMAYEIVDRSSIVVRASPHWPDDDPLGAFEEWHTNADQRAYESL